MGQYVQGQWNAVKRTKKCTDRDLIYVQELPRFLTEEYGIDSKYIDVKTKG